MVFVLVALVPIRGHVFELVHDFEVMGQVGGQNVVLQDVQRLLELVVGQLAEDVAAAAIQNCNCLCEVVSFHNRSL